jgi:O-antigen/teichoic acid export membrane protein
MFLRKLVWSKLKVYKLLDDHRYKAAFKTIVANFASKLASFLLMFYSIKYTLPYLGTERFGIWMVISSLMSIFLFLDLGIGNALTNKVSIGLTNEKNKYLNIVITNGLFSIFIISFTIFCLLHFLLSFAPFLKLFNLSDSSLNPEVSKSVQVFVAVFSLNIINNALTRIYYGLHSAFKAHISTLLGTIISFCLLYVVIINKGSIYYLIIAFAATQLFSTIFLLSDLLKNQYLTFSFNFSLFKSHFKDLLSSGFLFFLLQIGTIVIYSVDNLFITYNFGPSEVASFSIVTKLFFLVTQPLSIFNAPLWPAYSHAKAIGDKRFILSTFKMSLIVNSVFAIFVSSFIYFFGNVLVAFWTTNTIAIKPNLFLIYAIWVLIDVLGTCIGMLLNGLNIVLPQVIAVTIIILVGLPIKYFFLKYYGIEAMILGFSFVYISALLLSYCVIFRNRMISSITNLKRAISL